MNTAAFNISTQSQTNQARRVSFHDTNRRGLSLVGRATQGEFPKAGAPRTGEEGTRDGMGAGITRLQTSEPKQRETCPPP